MLHNKFILFFLAAVISFPSLTAASMLRGKITAYTSPGGILEQCIALHPMPGSSYHADDTRQEQLYCEINLYNHNTALCPKIWSTSPGTLIYDLTESPYAGKVSHFEQNKCRQQKNLQKWRVEKLAKFKTTMNDKKTSGTFATSSLLYYHFSRYFDTAVHVPVSVYRSIDRKSHLQRVTRNGVAWSSHNKMLHAGWQILAASEKNPSFYHPEDELFTADRKAVHGILLNSPGHRYNTEVNGTRASGWGKGQNFDFQKTAPYLALRSEKTLRNAVDHGLKTARNNRKINHDMGSDISREQMVYWMTELTEITLLDFIFNQQDRIGNIDYLSYWYWRDNGRLHRVPAHDKKIPAELADKNPRLLRRTQLNDNDAGARLSYINFTKKTKMLEKQRHYRAATYKKLLKLNQDFTARGELYQYLHNTFGLSEKQVANIVTNTAEATAILQHTCRTGNLRFDLDPDRFMRTGKVTEEQLNCDRP
jgi:hypothetical protein